MKKSSDFYERKIKTKKKQRTDTKPKELTTTATHFLSSFYAHNRETAMLYDPVVSAASNKQYVVAVVAHELAHQWFGNIVTPSWWTDLWLNEGFASYVEYIGINHVSLVISITCIALKYNLKFTHT